MVNRGGVSDAPHTPKAGAVSPRGTGTDWALPKAQGGRSVSVSRRAKSKPRTGEHPTPAPEGAAAGVRAGEARTTFCSLSANTAGSKHLLLHLPSSHCLQAFLWNGRDCPHTLFLISVYLSLQKAQRNLLHTAAKYNKTQAPKEEFSQLVPYNWSPISPSTFLIILLIITQAAWSSQSYQFPSNPFSNCHPWKRLGTRSSSLSLTQPTPLLMAPLKCRGAAAQSPRKGCQDPAPAGIRQRESIDPLLLTC